MNLSVESYEKKKKALLEEFSNHSGAPFSLNKNTSNLFRNRSSSETKKLDVKHLNRVIAIDPVQKTAEVEAMITFEDLVRETLNFGLLPPVVPELKTITVGGALVGLGIESSSFQYGLVHETILEVEVLTGNGPIVCTPENEHRDLFFALPNSYGTLGYVLKIKMKLIQAKKFVRITNCRFDNAQTYFDKLKEVCLKKSADFIDGVIFNSKEMYIILGDFVDEAPHLSDYTYMSPYYKSIRKKKTHYLTAHDYIWRWDADWFWCSKHMGMNNWFLRLLLGKWMLHSRVYWKIKHLVGTNRIFKTLVSLFEKPSESVIQDILIPIQNAPQFYQFFEKSIGITPVWICPFHFYHMDRKYTLFDLDPTTLYIDFGFWDIVRSNHPKGFLNRKIEKRTEELEGYKSLYSDSFYTEEEFWKIHPQKTFSQLKTKYDPRGVFKDLFAKCVRRK